MHAFKIIKGLKWGATWVSTVKANAVGLEYPKPGY